MFLALVAVHVGHMVAVRNEGWGTTQARMSLGYVAANLRVNGWFYLADERFPVIYTLLAILGLSGRRAEAGRLAMALYFLLFFGIALAVLCRQLQLRRRCPVLARDLSTAGDPGRAGAGSTRPAGSSASSPDCPRLHGLTAALAAPVLCGMLPVVRATTDGAWAARADVRFAQSLVPDLRGNSYVLTHNPGMFQVWGVNAGQMSLVGDEPGVLWTISPTRYPDGVYLHWNFWCNVQDPIQREFCTKVLALGPAEPVREYRERDQRLRPVPTARRSPELDVRTPIKRCD